MEYYAPIRNNDMGMYLFIHSLFHFLSCWVTHLPITGPSTRNKQQKTQYCSGVAYTLAKGAEAE